MNRKDCRPNNRIAWSKFTILVVCWVASPVICVNELAAQIDIQALEAHGLSVHQSQHLTLITDARGRNDVSEFNDVFEQAVEQWCQYFEIPQSAVEEWHLTGCVILDKQDKQKFVDAGLMPEDLPPFPAGYQKGSSIWVYVQDGDYYTRHLLVHEGTHAFMQTFLGGYGAAWYAEGMAELLGVHQWKDGKLEINHDIASRNEVPFWGRVKLVKQDRDNRRRKSLDEVLAIQGEDFMHVHTYGWAWAACEFLDSHPRYRKIFRKLPSIANLPPHEFNRQFRIAMADQWPAANQQWEILIDEIDYGYDVAMAEPVSVLDRTTDEAETRFTLAVNQGWQSTGIVVKAGSRVVISSSGMYQVKQDSQAWLRDAGGVTMEYYRGRPLEDG